MSARKPDARVFCTAIDLSLALVVENTGLMRSQTYLMCRLSYVMTNYFRSGPAEWSRISYLPTDLPRCAVAAVAVVRGFSFFGISFVYIHIGRRRRPVLGRSRSAGLPERPPPAQFACCVNTCPCPDATRGGLVYQRL